MSWCCANAVDDELEQLKAATLENTPDFGMKGKTIRAKVIDVYDGDTITLAFVFHGQTFQKKCRVSGVDCAEIRTRNAVERAVGFQGKDLTSTLTLDKIVTVEFDKSKDDKYGRLLGIIWLDDNKTRLDRRLIDAGLGCEYNGERKRPFADWYVK